MSLKYKLQQEGIESESLDEIVDDAASQLATTANNDGMKSQLDFLTVTCGWSDEDVVKVLKENGLLGD